MSGWCKFSSFFFQRVKTRDIWIHERDWLFTFYDVITLAGRTLIQVFQWGFKLRLFLKTIAVTIFTLVHSVALIYLGENHTRVNPITDLSSHTRTVGSNLCGWGLNLDLNRDLSWYVPLWSLLCSRRWGQMKQFKREDLTTHRICSKTFFPTSASVNA